MSISSNGIAAASAQSFNGWLEHSSLPSSDQHKLQRSFSEVADDDKGWEKFEKKVRAIVGEDKRLERRIYIEAKNAYTFPKIGTFFTWLNGNTHLSPERKTAITQVVRDTLFEATRFAHPSADKICSTIADELQRKSFRGGWQGNITHVVREIEAAVGQEVSSAQGKASPVLDKQALAEIFKQTQQASTRGYRAPNGTFVRIDSSSITEMQRSTHVFQECPPLGRIARRGTTEFSVVNKDSLRAAKDFVDQGEQPLVLNLANAQSPGGGVRGGSKAQEEDLMRCTNYFQALFPEQNPTLAHQLRHGKRGLKYRIPETGAIITRRVTVIRDGSKNYAFLDHPFEVSMLASAAYNLKPGHWGGPKGAKTKEGKVSKAKYDFETGTKMKIRTQLTSAANEGYTCLVLGAFGCGAFDNEPEKIAKWYKEFLDGEFRGVFKHVTFAVLGGTGPANHNFEVFSHVFDSKKRSRSEDSFSQSKAPAAAPRYKPETGSPVSRESKEGLDVVRLQREIEHLQQTVADLCQQKVQDEHMIWNLLETSQEKQAELDRLLK